MLDVNEQRYIADNFGVYDHNWLIYTDFLGEPFLIDNCIVYFDGTVLYICAFQLKAPHEPLDANIVIDKALSSKKFCGCKAIDIWGNYHIDTDRILKYPGSIS